MVDYYIDKNRLRTSQNDFIFGVVIVVQSYGTNGGAYGKDIRGIVYKLVELTDLDNNEYQTSKSASKKLKVEQRFNNIVSNWSDAASKLFVRTDKRGYFQLSELGKTIKEDELYKLIFVDSKKKEKKKKRNKKHKNKFQSQFDENTIIKEGKTSTGKVIRRGRSTVFREEKIRDNKAKYKDGKSRCEICGRITEIEIKINGIIITMDIIQVHHINPISEMKKDGTNATYSEVKDNGACLCPNCHVTLHKLNPTPHPDDLRDYLGY